MAKQKRLTNKIIVSLYIDSKIYNTFRAFCERKGYTMSKLVQNFMNEFVKDKK